MKPGGMMVALLGKGKEAGKDKPASKPEPSGGGSEDKALGMAFEAVSSGNKAAFAKAMKLAIKACTSSYEADEEADEEV